RISTQSIIRHEPIEENATNNRVAPANFIPATDKQLDDRQVVLDGSLHMDQLATGRAAVDFPTSTLQTELRLMHAGAVATHQDHTCLRRKTVRRLVHSLTETGVFRKN